MNDRIIMIFSIVAVILYFLIILFATLYYVIKNSKDKPVHYEKEGKLRVGVYDTGVKSRRYREFIFDKVDGEYILDKACKKDFIKGIVVGNIVALIFLMIPVITVLVVEDARIALPGLIVAIASIVTISIETEMYQYLKCVKYLRRNIDS